MLFEAYLEAEALRCPIWQLACEIKYLREAGISVTTLRSLVSQGYLEHALETTRPHSRERSFRVTTNLAFSESSCFILTHSGSLLARSTSHRHNVPTSVAARTKPHFYTEPASHPRFIRCDDGHRELQLDGRLVKSFKASAACQELILESFEELGWPQYTDDPLPVVAKLDPKKRLHDAISRLNRRQVNKVLRFHGNGNGKGIFWEVLERSDSSPTAVWRQRDTSVSIDR